MAECTFERLYLSKDNVNSENDIYVEKCPILQHQLDGIRFLYQAFKKKKPGVILNDPSGYGKRVQVALFLSAVLPTLEKSVLILCREGSQQSWVDHFRERTQISDEVAIELTNPFKKNKVLVSPSYLASIFTRRDWSLVVVDDCLSKDLKKAPLRCGLKIWITSHNIKEDLSQYSSFHSWLHPKEKFSAEKFKANSSDLKDVIAKAVMLDTFLRGTVLRRDTLQSLLSNKTSTRVEQASQVTRKNKDTTGTKVKRTKRKLENIDNTIKEDETSKVARVKDITNHEQEVSVIDSKNSEENLEDLEHGDNSENELSIQLKRSKTKKKPQVIWDSDSDEDVNKIQNNEMNTDEISQQTLRYDSETDTDNNTTTEKSVEIDNTFDPVNTIRNSSLCDNRNEIAGKSLVVHEMLKLKKDSKTEVPTTSVADEIKITDMYDNNDNDSESLINQISHAESLQKDKTSEKEMCIEVQNNVQPSEDVFTAISDNKYLDEKIKVSTDGDKTDINEEGTKKTEQDKGYSETGTLSSFDLKLKELEELTLRKYKGSFFDRIF